MRLASILQSYQRIFDEQLDLFNEQLRDQIEGTSVALEGKKILEFLQSTQKDSVEPADLRDYLDDTIFELVEKLAGEIKGGVGVHLRGQTDFNAHHPLNALQTLDHSG